MKAGGLSKKNTHLDDLWAALDQSTIEGDAYLTLATILIELGNLRRDFEWLRWETETPAARLPMARSRWN